jgi:hypothetical protein
MRATFIPYTRRIYSHTLRVNMGSGQYGVYHRIAMLQTR